VTPRRWAVVGVGGVGGLYAARLHAAGCEVHLVARSDAEALRRDGLHLTSPLGDVHARLPVHVDPATVPEVDVVALATKTTAPGAAGVASAIAARHPGAALLVLQNGLGVEAAAGAPAGTTVLGGMAFVCSQRVGPGRIEHLDFGPVSVGEHRADGTAAGSRRPWPPPSPTSRPAGWGASPCPTWCWAGGGSWSGTCRSTG